MKENEPPTLDDCVYVLYEHQQKGKTVWKFALGQVVTQRVAHMVVAALNNSYADSARSFHFERKPANELTEGPRLRGERTPEIPG